MKFTPPLLLLSLAASACLPSGSGSGDGQPHPPDVFGPDGEEPSDLPFNGQCTRDLQCARLLVCENYYCVRRICSTQDDCGEDEDEGNDRGCDRKSSNCTAQECVTAAGLTCADFGREGVCDGRVCQAQ